MFGLKQRQGAVVTEWMLGNAGLQVQGHYVGYKAAAAAQLTRSQLTRG